MQALKQLSTNKLLIIACTIIHMGFGTSVFYGVPIWFESPKTKCYDKQTQTYYQCQENIACKQFDEMNQKNQYDNDYSSIIDYQRSRNSLGLKYQLICKNRQIQFDCMGYINYGAIFGNLFNLIFRINSNKYRNLFLQFLLVLMPLSLWIQFLFDDIYYRSLVLSIYSFSRIAMHTIQIDMVFTYYNKKVSTFFPVYQTFAYVVAGIAAYPIQLILKGNFTYCIIFDAIPLTISAIIFIIQINKLKPDSSVIDQFELDEASNKNMPISLIITDITQIFKENDAKQVILGLVNFMFIQNTLCLSVYILDVFNDGVKILFYINIFGFIGVLLSGIVQQKFNQQKAQFISYNILMAINISCYYLPFSLITSNSLQKQLFFVVLILNGFLASMQFSQSFLIITYYFSAKSLSFMINGGSILAKYSTVKIPGLHYSLRYKYDINILFISGILYFLMNLLNFFFMRKMKYESAFKNLSVQSLYNSYKQIIFSQHIYGSQVGNNSYIKASIQNYQSQFESSLIQMKPLRNINNNNQSNYNQKSNNKYQVSKDNIEEEQQTINYVQLQ